MNQLTLEKRTQIITLLVEGNSLRSTSRISGCSINTVSKLLVDAGKACLNYHNETVKNLQSVRVQCDEIWSFVGAKGKNVTPEMKENGLGDVWTWSAIDADSKLVISWLVGDRTGDNAEVFMKDIAARLSNRVQLSTDGLSLYVQAVDEAFAGVVDFAQIHKIYGTEPSEGHKKYSSPECIGTKKNIVFGNPERKHISTSYIERQNLTMRMSMRRFTRLTNAFSKKIENHCHAIALHFMYYNFVRVHKTLRVTPAMEAGLTTRPLTIENIVELIK